MRSLRLCLALTLALFAAAPASAALSGYIPSGFIHTKDRGFVDSQGHSFPMRGIGLGNWLVPEGYMFHFTRARAPREIAGVVRAFLGPEEAEQFWASFRENYVTRADIQFIARAGFTTLRVPFDWKLFARAAGPPGQTPVLEGPGYALLDRLIGWCKEAGLRVILDMHAAPGGQTGVNHDDGPGYALLFYVPADQALTIAIWRKLAARYASETAVLGYDLLNEPICPYLDETTLNPLLAPFYARLQAAIRAVDQNHVLFLQGAQWASNLAVLGHAADPNMAVSYHMFWAHPVRASIAPMLDYAIAENVPLWLGESGEANDRWNARFIQLQERYGIGWSFWTFKTMDSTSTVLSIPAIPGWDSVAALGNAAPADWPVLTPAQKNAGRQALHAYLAAMLAQNTVVNGCYLASLGLRDPQIAAKDCTAHRFLPQVRLAMQD